MPSRSRRAPGNPAPRRPRRSGAQPGILFDDFAYTDRAQLEAHGWIVRTAAGWPGVLGAAWSAENVSFHANPARAGDRVLRMTSSTDGTQAGTTHAQICHRRKYREGTYAARVRFRDAPAGDQLVETFYAISPPKAPMDPGYSELDFEYLPNGGWVFHRAGAVLSPRAVSLEVARLRRDSLAFRDTVPAAQPPLASPCDL